MKGSIECKAQFQNSMMKMRNCRRCQNFRGVKLSFKEGRDNTMSMVVEVGEEEGEVESRDYLREPRPRGKGLETLMPQEQRHQFKLG
jgi:hypothetical protein